MEIESDEDIWSFCKYNSLPTLNPNFNAFLAFLQTLKYSSASEHCLSVDSINDLVVFGYESIFSKHVTYIVDKSLQSKEFICRTTKRVTTYIFAYYQTIPFEWICVCI